MRITQNRIPILVAALAAFILGAIPQLTHAQTPPPVGGFNTTDCFNQMQNGYTNTSQAHTVAAQKVMTNGAYPDFKIIYCFTTIIQPLINSISALTEAASTNGSAIGAAIGAMLQSLLLQIVTQLINTLCGIVANAISSALSMIKSWMCIPIPHFHLSLHIPGFAQGSCSGMSLLNLANNIVAGGRVVPPNVFSIWGLNGQY